MRKLGAIVALQCQPDRVKVKGEAYLPHLIKRVERASLSGGGMFGFHDGSWLVDVHHPLHPSGRGKAHRAVSFGFTSHYAAMGRRFGEIAPYVAGENIIVDTPEMIALDELASGLVIRTADGDVPTSGPTVLAPCREFTSHLMSLPEPAEKEALTDELAFLGDGMRGFGVGVDGGPHMVRLGDEVWVRDA